MKTFISIVLFAWIVTPGICTVQAKSFALAESNAISLVTKSSPWEDSPGLQCSIGLPISIANGATCVGGSVELSAGAGSGANTLRWYTASSGGSHFMQSTSYDIFGMTASVTYYISSYNTLNHCESARVPITATVSPVPGAPMLVSGSRCGTGAVTLTATPGANGNTVAWFTSDGTFITHATSYTTPSISANTDYKIKSYNGCYSSTYVTVTATINPIPSSPSLNNLSACTGGTITLTGGVGANGNAINWYAAASGGGTISTSQIISSTTNFYGSTFNTATGCESSRLSNTVTAVANPAVPTNLSQDGVVCGSGSVELNALPGSGGSTLRWYTNASGGTHFLQAMAHTIFGLSVTTTFYISSYNTSLGCESARIPITATVSPVPGAPTPGHGSRCGTGTITLSATQGSGSNTVAWYTAAEVFITTGTSYTTPSLSSTTAYKIKSYNSSTGCYSSAFVTVNATINPIPSSPSISNNSACIGSTVTLAGAVGANGNVINWYAAASGGSPISASQTISSTTTFYGSSFNTATACESPRSSIVITAVANPASPTSPGQEAAVCGSGSAQLFALPASGCTLRWYSSSSGSAALYTGIVFDTPTLSVSTTYYITSYNQSTGCESTRTPITATISPIVGAPTVSPVTICPGIATLIATRGANTSEVKWYTLNMAHLFTGDSYQPTVNATTTFKVRGENGGCVSSTVTVTVTVSPVPGTPSFLTPNSICSGVPFTLSGTPGSSATGINWYAVATGGSPIPTTQTITSSTTFYAASVAASTGCESNRIARGVNVNPLPAAPAFQFENYLCGFPGTVQIVAYPPSGSSVRWYSVETGGGSLTADDPDGYSFTTPSLSAPDTYYIAARSSAGCESSPRVAVVVDLKAIPAPPQLADARRCGPGSLTLTASSPGNTIYWYNNTNTVVATGSAYTTPELQSDTTLYFARAISLYCTSAADTAKAIINPIPPNPDPEFFGSTMVRGHGRVTILSDFYARWYSDSLGGNLLGEGFTYKTPDIGTREVYYLSRYDSLTQCESGRVRVVANIKPLITNGYVKTETIRISGIMQDSLIVDLALAEKATTIEYFDGLLRPVLQTFVHGSLSGKDVIQPIEYDPYGRTPKQYLPYVSGDSTGIYRPEYKAEQLAFYAATNDKIANDTHPFAISKFEPSPLGRILEQGGVGTGFQPDDPSPHTAKANYSYNTGATNSEAEEVRRFNSDGTSSGFYAANTLSRTQSTDQHGDSVITFTDGQRKTIVVKQQFDTASYLQTYYIYDDFGRIKYIVSPKGVSTLRLSGWNLTPILDQFVHQFTYDSRGRIAEKKVPGKAVEYFVYDKYDRLVLMQDGILRATNQWLFTKYDVFGRAVMQGLYTNTVDNTRTKMETLVNGLYKISNANYPPDARFENRLSSTYGYTNVSFPKINQTGSAVLNTQYNYYDNYDFDSDGTEDYSYTKQALTGEEAAPQGRADGMPTGSKTLVLNGGTTYLTTYVFYDKKGRFIQKRSNSLLNTVIENLSTVTYDFEGKAIASRGYNRHAPDKINRNEYDTQGRLKTIYGTSPLTEPVQWAAGSNVTIAGTDVQKTSGANNTWNAGTISINYLAANENGWVEFKAGETNTHKTIGLSANNASVSDNSINFGIRMANNGTLAIYENGVHMGAVGPYTVNDILSVERRNGRIYYRRNFEVIRESAVSNTGALYIDCALFTTNASIKNVTLSRSQEFKMAQYEYNELGQLVDKKLHNTSGNDFLQSVDYRYNIRGQLTSINNAPLTDDGDVLNDETTDHFGLEMMYHTTDASLSNTPYYNGNISAIKWKGVGQATGNAGQRSYQYTYDKANRLENAISKMNSGSAWNKEENAFNESMTYDHNGNILTLQRNDRQHSLTGYTSQQIDNLTYGYDVTTGDRLKNVEDVSGHAAGFSNVANANTVSEFSYDGNGNVTADVNKGILSITYNYLGKPTVINFTGGKKIEYTYDGVGTKLRMRTLQGTTPLDTTDYVGDYVYDNGKLKYFGSPEGRTVLNGTKAEYQYAIADHQGNTRVVFTSAPQTPSSPVATFEGDANDQSSQYTMGGNVVTFFAANHTPSGIKVVRMNQTTPVGPSKSMKVYPGDKIDMEVWTYFEGSSGWGNSNTGMSALITNVATAFSVASGGAIDPGTTYSAVNTAYTTMGTAGNQGDAAPSAYLNYILYDKDYKFLTMGWQAVPASANMAQQKISIPTVNISEPGYIFVYLSYEGESNQWINFDDFKVTHTKTNVIQYNEYYPFGLSASTSWTREGNKNDYLYNAGSEINVTSGWYDLPFRNYDPALGRFMQVDLLAASEMATYQYAGNNPVMLNDPMGAKRESYNRAYWLSTQFFRSDEDDLKGLPPGDGLGGGYVDWDASAVGPSVAEIKQRDDLRSKGYNAHFNAKGEVEIWEDNSYVEWEYFFDDEGNLRRTGTPVIGTRKVVAAGNAGPGDPPWVSFLKDHYFLEAGFEVSVGAQATFAPTQAGIIPAPFIRGGQLGISVNLGSVVLVKGQANLKSGASMTTILDSNIVTQGLGFALGGTSIDYTRTVTGSQAENVVNLTTLGGLLGIEYNFTNSQLSIGMMPSASFSLIGGIQGNVSNGLRFQF